MLVVRESVLLIIHQMALPKYMAILFEVDVARDDSFLGCF